ncbi:uncharacterized protein TNCV_2781731 [Trichonephila clavipes]|nr:uncharacterized protein TNCV_2781731 [Trichonephila clavipes]
MDPMLLCPGKGLVLPNLHIDQISANTRFLLISLPNNEMSSKSPFATQKALIGIGGEPKSVIRLISGDLLIETLCCTNQVLPSCKNVPEFISVTISPHKTLNSCCGVISEPDLLTTPEAEILEGFSNQGIIQCQRFGHSQTSCRFQVTGSRCASVGHSSSDCTLEPKCFNCSQSHSSDSKLCPKWKIEKQIQEIKTNKNISYPEARKLIVPQLSPTYAQAAKSSTSNNSTQTDENITKIKCSPLKLLEPLSSKLKPNASISTPNVSRSSSTQAQILPSTSSITTAYSESQLPIPTSNDAPSTSNDMHALSTETS